MGLSIIGAAIAFIVSQGFSGSLHAFFGIATIILGCLQVISSWFRGKHGGRYYYTGHEDDPSSWEGDHYNMTPKRRKFRGLPQISWVSRRFLCLWSSRLRFDAVPSARISNLCFYCCGRFFRLYGCFWNLRVNVMMVTEPFSDTEWSIHITNHVRNYRSPYPPYSRI